MMADMNDFDKDLIDFEVNLKDALGDMIMKPIPVRLGFTDTTGNRLLKVAATGSDEPNLYYFHEMAGNGFQGIAYMQSGLIKDSQIRYNAPVRIRKDPVHGQWEIIGLDTRYANLFFDGVPEDEGRYVPYENLAPSMLTQTEPNSMKARVIGGAFTMGDDWKYINTQDTVDWSLSPDNANVPTTNGKARLVMVQLNWTTGLLEYTYGAEFPSTLTIEQAYALGGTVVPTLTANRFRCGLIKLNKGMTKITRKANIWTLQDYISKGGTIDPSVLDLIIVDVDGNVVTDGGNVVYATP